MQTRCDEPTAEAKELSFRSGLIAFPDQSMHIYEKVVDNFLE